MPDARPTWAARSRRPSGSRADFDCTPVGLSVLDCILTGSISAGLAPGARPPGQSSPAFGAAPPRPPGGQRQSSRVRLLAPTGRCHPASIVSSPPRRSARVRAWSPLDGRRLEASRDWWQLVRDRSTADGRWSAVPRVWSAALGRQSASFKTRRRPTRVPRPAPRVGSGTRTSLQLEQASSGRRRPPLTGGQPAFARERLIAAAAALPADGIGRSTGALASNASSTLRCPSVHSERISVLRGGHCVRPTIDRSRFRAAFR